MVQGTQLRARNVADDFVLIKHGGKSHPLEVSNELSSRAFRQAIEGLTSVPSSKSHARAVTEDRSYEGHDQGQIAEGVFLIREKLIPGRHHTRLFQPPGRGLDCDAHR
jgi:hypothetical protein